MTDDSNIQDPLSIEQSEDTHPFVKSGTAISRREKKKRDEAIAELKKLYEHAEEYDVLQISPSMLTPYENNPRLNATAVPYVIESIREYGFRSPIVTDEDFVVLSGHTRLKASLEMGLETVPVLIARGLSEEQKVAYRIADNQVGAVAGWDFDALELEFLKIHTIDMTKFACNFSFEPCIAPYEDDEDDEWDSDSGEVSAPGPIQEIVMDDAPVIGEEESYVKPGDIYELGDHLLVCEAPVDGDNVHVLIEGRPYGFGFIYPPYKDTDRVTMEAGKVLHGVNCLAVYSDTFKSDSFGYSTFLAHSSEHVKDIFYWISDNPPLARQGHISYSATPIPLLSNNSESSYSRELGGFTGVIKGEDSDRVPMYVSSELIQIFTDEGDTVLVVYGGEGDIMSVCNQLGRKCVILEPNPQKCYQIIRRWEQMTGLTALATFSY